MSDPRDETICDVSATLLQLLKEDSRRGERGARSAEERRHHAADAVPLQGDRERLPQRMTDRRSLPAGVDGRLVEQEPPLIVDLYYLLTAHHATDQLEAHRGLSRAMRVFYDNAILRGSPIQDDQGRGLTSDTTLRITLNPISMEDMTRIWSVFPDTQYEISVTYLVTPVPIESIGRSEPPPSSTRFTITGMCSRQEREPRDGGSAARARSRHLDAIGLGGRRSTRCSHGCACLRAAARSPAQRGGGAGVVAVRPLLLHRPEPRRGELRRRCSTAGGGAGPLLRPGKQSFRCRCRR